MPTIIRAFRERNPAIDLSSQQSNTPLLLAALHSGQVDVAFIRPPVSDGEGLLVLPLVEEPMLIVLPAAHSLASRDAVPIAALAQEQLILFPRSIGPGLYDAVMAAFQRAGFSPNLGQEAPQISSIVYMVAAGFGVSVVPQINRADTGGRRAVPSDRGGRAAGVDRPHLSPR